MPITKLKHKWIKHTLTPVSVLEDANGDPVVFVDPDDQVISEDHAVYGCDACGEAMVDNLQTECVGDSDEEA